MKLKQNSLLVKIAYLPNNIWNTCEKYERKKIPIQINFWVFAFKVIISPILTPFLLFVLGIATFFLFMALMVFTFSLILEWILAFTLARKRNNDHRIDSLYVQYKKWPAIAGRRIYPAFLLLFLPIICACLDLYSGKKLSIEEWEFIVVNIAIILIVVFWKTISTFLISLRKILKDMGPILKIEKETKIKSETIEEIEKRRKYEKTK